jgi:putative restriction endonuclease
MRIFVGVTDGEWYRFLRDQPQLDEVNFWQPSGSVSFRALDPGDLFLFKLHYPQNVIVGGGTFLYSNPFPMSIAWEAFGEKNGALTAKEMRARIEKYRRRAGHPAEDYMVGCIILKDPFFFDETQWMLAPPDWRPNIVRGKTYYTQTEIGRQLWEEGTFRMQVAAVEREGSELPMFGEPALVRPRLGQGSFRMVVTDAYQRRCSVTREKALPVLEASHIRPVSEGGQHAVSNGLLLRSDVHTLFDRGYVTITPEYEFRVSRRLRDEFDNGEEYFAM